ncbi:ATP synthase subunit O, mitochondrial-like [Trichoplusia ni]|uniref:Oligomycin sensitivity conferral protein n=1 Tax=Trichoplusia ni TaxID=7111 RepID=A0A7E5VAH5_TRINI|nr:ATP synthase subunit O, mitochondrial-like [Trichoplusia ni]
MLRLFMRTMTTSTIAVKPPISVFGVEGRYVTALYSAASQKKQLEAVEKSLRDFRKLLTKPKIVDFIETSLISRAAKAKLLIEAGKQAGMPDTAANFLGLVAENGRLKMLRRMINMFLSVMVAHRNEALCEVITAEPLDEATRKTLVETLKKFVKSGQNIQLTEKVRPSIIGGMIVGIEDKHIDMSIARKVLMYSELLKIGIL